MSASGPKRTCASALQMSAFGGKADMPFASQMSAYDPKRTCREFWSQQPMVQRRSVSAGSRIGTVGRSAAKPLAIDRRGLRLRRIEAVRCAIALSVDVDGLCL